MTNSTGIRAAITMILHQWLQQKIHKQLIITLEVKWKQ